MTEPFAGHADHDDLVALALGQVGPRERERLSGHLAACGPCRADYAGIEDAVAHTLAAAPSIAPPAGFSGRVLAGMGLEAPAPASGSARRSWTPYLAAAAALVVGLGLGVAATLTLVTPPGAPQVASTPGTATSASDLVNRTGETVGTAGVTSLAGEAYLVITVTGARPGLAYECVVVAPDGRRTRAGAWTLDARYGPKASGTWVVAVPEGGVEHVELLTPSGEVWSRATL